MHSKRHILIAQGQDQHFVICQQTAFHGFAKPNAINFFSKQCGIIHRTQNCIRFRGFAFAIVIIQTRGRGHIQTLLGLDKFSVNREILPKGISIYAYDMPAIFREQRYCGTANTTAGASNENISVLHNWLTSFQIAVRDFKPIEQVLDGIDVNTFPCGRAGVGVMWREHDVVHF